jgi:hypothetical protein
LNNDHRPPRRGRGKSILAQLNKQNRQSQKMRATKGNDVPDIPPAAPVMHGVVRGKGKRNDFADALHWSIGKVSFWVGSNLTFGNVWDVAAPEPSPPLPVSKRVGGIVAYRGWTLTGTLDDPVLKSVAVDTEWAGPALAADSKPLDHAHEAWAARTGHGIYAYKTAHDFFEGHGSTSLVWGQVLLYGKVVVHERGCRAERAMIRNLVLSPRAWVKWGDALASKLAQRYGCDVFTDYRELFKGSDDGGPR